MEQLPCIKRYVIQQTWYSMTVSILASSNKYQEEHVAWQDMQLL